MTKYKFSKIADMLLEGKITSKKAEDLVRKLEVNSSDSDLAGKDGKNLEILVSKNHLRFLDNGNEKAYIQFYMGEDDFNENYLFLQSAESYEEGKGYFRNLFNKLKFLACEKGASYILLEVDCKNENAISVYEHLGFYSAGPINTVSENIDRILMRRDLELFDCE